MMSLFDIGIGLLASADGFDKVGLVPLVRKISLILIDDFASFDDHLPPATMSAQIHDGLGAIDLNPGRRGWPMRPLVAIANFAREFLHVVRGIPVLANHGKVTIVIGDALKLGNFALRLSKPPEGYANWTLDLLQERVVALSIVDSVSRETLRKTLKKME